MSQSEKEAHRKNSLARAHNILKKTARNNPVVFIKCGIHFIDARIVDMITAISRC